MLTIVKMKFGSHLYGTTTPSSDVDFKAVHLPGSSDIILGRAANSIRSGISNPEGVRNQPGAVDTESYSLQWFMKLASDGQTGPLDMLFAPDSAILEKTYIWDEVVQNRNRLLSSKSAAFLGYCREQSNKYGLKGSRMASVKTVSDLLFNKSVDLGGFRRVYEIGYDELNKLCDENTKIIEQVVNPRGDVGTFLECCGRKASFNQTIHSAWKIFFNLYKEYGDRAAKAKDNEGIDWKALSHSVRVGQEALELLTTGKITLPLPDADHIRKIKLGEISYTVVESQITDLMRRVEAASLVSVLPDTANKAWVDQFVYSTYLNHVLETM